MFTVTVTHGLTINIPPFIRGALLTVADEERSMVTRPHSEFEPNPWDLSAVGHRCFFCGKFLQDPAVLCTGANGQQIYLHADCVVDWMPALMRDALALRYADHPCQATLHNERANQ